MNGIYNGVWYLVKLDGMFDYFYIVVDLSTLLPLLRTESV